MQLNNCNVPIYIKKLLDRAIAPTKATEGSAGFDLYSCVTKPAPIEPNNRLLISTGIAIEIPSNCCGMICSRSGLAAKHGVFVLNAPGIIDSDYRGEIKVLLCNLGTETIVIENGQRIAQLVIVPVITSELKLSNRLIETVRGAGGFGSTGL